MKSCIRDSLQWNLNSPFLLKIGQDNRLFIKACIDAIQDEGILACGLEIHFDDTAVTQVDFGYMQCVDKPQHNLSETANFSDQTRAYKDFISRSFRTGADVLKRQIFWELDSNDRNSIATSGIFFSIKKSKPRDQIFDRLIGLVADARPCNEESVGILRTLKGVDQSITPTYLGRMLGRDGHPWIATISLTNSSQLEALAKVFPAIAFHVKYLSDILPVLYTHGYKCNLGISLDLKGLQFGLEFWKVITRRGSPIIRLSPKILDFLGYPRCTPRIIESWIASGFRFSNDANGNGQCGINHGKISFRDGRIVARKVYVTTCKKSTPHMRSCRDHTLSE